MSFLKKILVCTALLLGVGACAFFVRENAFDAFGVPARECKSFEAAFPLTLGGKKLSVRAAITELERQRGLTGCRGLPENSGMIFVYPDESRRGFWMRGVPVGLSVGFFDANGILLETHEMRANDLSVTSSRSERVKFVLEMPSGWFDENGVRAGTALSLRELAGIVGQRGFSPEKFEIRPEE